ncbi:MAG: hypothetical protein U0235_26020 [Polyangiaceae bacterium]
MALGFSVGSESTVVEPSFTLVKYAESGSRVVWQLAHPGRTIRLGSREGGACDVSATKVLQRRP